MRTISPPWACYLGHTLAGTFWVQRWQSWCKLQSVKIFFSASFLFSQQNRPPFYCWHNHDFHINIFIHLIHVVKQMHKMSGKYLKNISLKSIFLFPCIIFKVNCQLWGSVMPSCNITPYQWCVYWLLGLSEDLREELKINKRASVRLYSFSSPLTACRPSKYPVLASVQSTNSTNVFTLWCKGIMEIKILGIHNLISMLNGQLSWISRCTMMCQALNFICVYN